MRALVVVNAGSTASYSLPIPIGFLKTCGIVMSPVNRLAESGGIFCIAGDHLAIRAVLRLEPPRCSDAVQRGPLLSDSLSGKGVSGRSRRSTVALDDRGRLVLLVTEPTTLSAVAAFLYKTELDLRVQSALNLDGSTSSGLIMTTGPSDTEPIVIGNVDGLVASAIVVTERK